MNDYKATIEKAVNEALNYCIDSDDTLGTGYSFKKTTQPLIVERATAILLKLITEARDEYPWEKIQRHATYGVPITHLGDHEPFVEYDECYMLPKKWVDEEALKGEK